MNIYNEIVNQYPIKDENTKIVTNIFRQISSDKLNTKKTKVFIESDFIHINLTGTSAKYCDISFMIGIKKNIHKIFIDFFSDINILYYEDFSTSEGLDDVIETLIPILESEIIKKDYYVKNKLIKSVITCDKYKLNNKEFIEFTKKRRIKWFFVKTTIKTSKYNPWISNI